MKLEPVSRGSRIYKGLIEADVLAVERHGARKTCADPAKEEHLGEENISQTTPAISWNENVFEASSKQRSLDTVELPLPTPQISVPLSYYHDFFEEQNFHRSSNVWPPSPDPVATKSVSPPDTFFPKFPREQDTFCLPASYSLGIYSPSQEISGLFQAALVNVVQIVTDAILNGTEIAHGITARKLQERQLIASISPPRLDNRETS